MQNKITMNLQEKVFNEIKINNLKKGDLWRTQKCIKFQFKLNSLEKEEFESVMNKLCEDGLFKKEDYLLGERQYILTEKGERYIYN